MRLIVPFVLLLLAACSSTAFGPEDELEVRAARDLYAPWDTVEVVLRNRATQTLYLAHCDHRLTLMLQKRVQTEWTNHLQVNGPFCQAIYAMGDTAIAPGAQLRQRVHIGETGTFRFLVYARRASDDFGDIAVHSPSFGVSYPPD